MRHNRAVSAHRQTVAVAAAANSPVRFLRYHAAVEAAIQASGMAYTFLRPNLFMQGLLNFRSMIATQTPLRSDR